MKEREGKTKERGFGRDVLNERPAIGAHRAGSVNFCVWKALASFGAMVALRSEAFIKGGYVAYSRLESGRTRLGRFLYLGRVIFGAKWRAVDVSFTKASWILYRYYYPYQRGLGIVLIFLLLLLLLLLQSVAC